MSLVSRTRVLCTRIVTRDLVLVYGGPGTPIELRGVSDSTLINNQLNSRSTMGNHINLGSGSISWRSLQQRRIAHSSSDAEYIGLNEAGTTIKGHRNMLEELGFPQTAPTPLLNDNQGALKMSASLVNHHGNRHVTKEEHLIREYVKDGIVNPSYVPTKELSADMLTKALPSPAFVLHRAALGLRRISDWAFGSSKR